MQKPIRKAAIALCLDICISAYVGISGYGLILGISAPAMMLAMPVWQSAAFGAASIACINGIWYFGTRLDEIVTREAVSRAELLAAWRR